MARIVKTSTLYTLIVKPDQSFEIKIDGESSRNGTLLDDFTPSVNPEAEIDDEDDKKPEDWDEDAPFEVVDETAEKPEDWLEDEPKTIPDPEAEKPEDWDDEEDGDWDAPLVRNPNCDEVSGCGPWTKPTKPNPAFKGKWTAPLVDNPLYKGVWAPRKIANPNYFEDKTPANFEPIGAIGIELWSMQNDILFDNIYIGHSIEDAKKLEEETFVPKKAAEKAEEEATAPKPKESPKSPSDLVFMDDPALYVKEKVKLFLEIAKKDPVEAARFVPEVAGGIATLAVTFLVLLVSLFAGSSAAPSKEQLKAQADKAKKTAVDVKDKAAEAVATGAEKAKAEVNKRQTRSGAQ